MLLVLAVLAAAGLAVALVVADPPAVPEVANLAEPPRSADRGGVQPDPRYELLALGGPPAEDDILVFLAFSGGGKRSAAFSYGVLEGLREIGLPATGGAPARPMIEAIDLISGVSGGSFTAAAFGLHGEALFDGYRQRFLEDPTQDRIYGLYLLPWHWDWLLDAEYDRSDAMAEIYDDLLFDGADYVDLSDRGRPMVVLGATDVVLGTSFLFTQRQFDLLCGDLNPFPLSRAVAASNGFPGLFSPITLTRHGPPCDGREPDWLLPLARIDGDALDREAVIAEEYRRYLHRDVRYVHLMDGGIGDNLALRGLVNAIILFDNLLYVPRDSEYVRIRRVLLVSVDGEAAIGLDRAQEPGLSGLMNILEIVSGTQIDNYNQETLLLSSLVLEEFEGQLARLRCNVAAEIGGHPCDAVNATFVRLSLGDIRDADVRERLSAIPTGLSLEPEDVEALVAAGRAIVTRSPDIRAFAEGLSAPAD